MRTIIFMLLCSQDSVIIYYHSDGTTDVGPGYLGRASLDVDIPSGKFNLKLSSATLNDNKKFKCHIKAKSDTSKSYATTRIVVLGKISFVFKEIFCFVL